MQKKIAYTITAILLFTLPGFSQVSKFELELAAGSFRYDVLFPGGVAFKGNARYNVSKWLSLVGGYQMATYSSFPSEIRWDSKLDNGYERRNGLPASLDNYIREQLMKPGDIMNAPEWNLSRYHSFTIGPTVKFFSSYKVSLGLFYHLQYMHTTSLTMFVTSASIHVSPPPSYVKSYEIATIPASSWNVGPVWGAELEGKITSRFSLVANASRYDVFYKETGITVHSFSHNHASLTLGARYRLQ
jgi:hypothetical protein